MSCARLGRAERRREERTEADPSRAIFEEVAPPSSDEEDEEELARRTGEIDLDAEDEDEEGGTAVLTSHMRHFVIQVGSWS